MESGNSLIHAKHVIRAGILLSAVLVALVLGRSAFVPPTWGDYGWFRGANVTEHMAKPLRHLGNDVCEPCHSEQYEAHAGGVHNPLRCELCHGPAALHVNPEDGEKIADMPIQRSRELCVNCHGFLVARPSGFPQVDPRQHVSENGGEFSQEACFECHDPHSPY